MANHSNSIQSPVVRQSTASRDRRSRPLRRQRLACSWIGMVVTFLFVGASFPSSMPTVVECAAFVPAVGNPPRIGRGGLVRKSLPTRLAGVMDPIVSLLQHAGLDNVATSLSGAPDQAVAGAAAIVAGALFAATRPPARLISDTTLSTLVQGTFLQRADEANNLVCLYKASVNGWSALDFHEAVDNVGSAVVVARTVLGQTVGGYNPVGWRSTDDYTASTAAFLWTSTNNKVIKFPVLGGGDNAAIFDFATAGPCFGSSDFILGPQKTAVMGGFAGPDSEDLSGGAGDLKEGLSNAAYAGTYQTNRQWPLRGRFRLVEVEVYGNGQNR